MDCSPNALAAASRCYCLPADRARAAQIYSLCAWASEEVVEGCGDPSNVIRITGAGTAAVNQDYTETTPGVYVGANPQYEIVFDGVRWLLQLSNLHGPLYFSLGSNFPCTWRRIEEAGHAPSPTGQWIGVPEAPFSYSPPTENIHWIDGNGTHDSNLAGFVATADYPTVTLIRFQNQVNLTAITGLQHFPNLQILQCDTGGPPTWASTSITSIDVSGLTMLGALHVGFNSLTYLNVTGCTNLGVLECSGNALTSIVGLATCHVIVGFYGGHNLLTSLPEASTWALLGDIGVQYTRITSLTIPAGSNITYNNGIIQLDHNPFITTLAVGAGSVLGSDILSSDCPLLTSVNLNNLIFNEVGSGAIMDFHNCGLNQSSVDACLALAVAAGFDGMTPDVVHLNGGTNSAPTNGNLNANFLALSGAGVDVTIN